MAKFNLPDPYIAEMIRWAESIGATPTVPRVTKRYKRRRRPCGTGRKRSAEAIERAKQRRMAAARTILLLRGLGWTL